MSISNYIRSFKAELREWWVQTFWKHPDQLWALKVTVTIAALLIPCVIAGEYFIGSTLGMGVVGTALAETDVHPRGRLKSLSVTLLCVFVASGITELLKTNPVAFSLWLVVLGFGLTLLGGISKRLQGITFGTILISIYTMLGMNFGMPLHYQPLLLPAGGLFYGILSMTIFYSRPFRLLEEQLATGFDQLASYVAIKAQFFPSTAAQQERLRNQLAQKNVEVVDQIELCKNNLNSFREEAGKKSLQQMNRFYSLWMLLQEIHERAASSHEQYDVLSNETKNSELIEGFGQILSEIAKAIKDYSESLLTNKPYHTSVSLKWAVAAQKNMLANYRKDGNTGTLQLLMNNLQELELQVQNLSAIEAQPAAQTGYSGRPQIQKLSELLNTRHPRFRFAVRLAFCFVVSYLCIYFFKIDKGYWIILTVFLVCQQTYSATRQRLLHRTIGTLAGVLLGIALTPVFTTMAAQVILLLVSIFLFFSQVKKRYSIAVVFITVFVLASFNILSNTGLQAMLPRLIDTLIGSAIVFIAVRFMWPDWQYKQLPATLLTAISNNKRYFDSVYATNISDENYNHIRRRAHHADSALTLAWKGMRFEPRSKRVFQKKAFNLTYLNHALLSYISAFGIHDFREHIHEGSLATYKKLSWILAETVTVLSGKEAEPDAVLKAKNIEAQLFEKKYAGGERESILFHNMSRIATELLIEAQDLMANKDEEIV